MKLHILGCGSAKPTLRHDPSAQLLECHGHLALIDAGEGVQKALRRQHVRFTQIDSVFISHLHGDHVLGLLPLLSTLAHLGRTAPLHLYAPAPLEKLLAPWLPYSGVPEQYELLFHPHPGRGILQGGEADEDVKPVRILDEGPYTVDVLPLAHRVPCWGFIFRELPALPHMRRDMMEFLQIPHYAVRGIKEGAGWTTPEGDFYAHERLTTPPAPPSSYAYLSDTAFAPALIPALHGITTLYHEATYADDCLAVALERGHSTARGAATLAARAQVGRLLLGHYSSRYGAEEEQQLLAQALEAFPRTALTNETDVFEF